MNDFLNNLPDILFARKGKIELKDLSPYFRHHFVQRLSDLSDTYICYTASETTSHFVIPEIDQDTVIDLIKEGRVLIKDVDFTVNKTTGKINLTVPLMSNEKIYYRCTHANQALSEEQVVSLKGDKGDKGDKGTFSEEDVNLLETRIKTSTQESLKLYLPLSGGDMSGALNFKNTTWNEIGDDAFIGDCDVSGCVGIKGQNGNTGLVFDPYSGNIRQSISIDGGGTMTITGNTLRTPSIDASLIGSGQFRAVCGDYGFLIRNDGVHTYFMLTNSGDPYGTYNALRPITINNATGHVDITGNITGNADTVDGKHASAFILTTASCNKNWRWSGQDGQPSWLWGSDDGSNCYVWNPANFSVANAQKVKNRDLCTEVDNLKASVANGKQAVVNAINNKLGYASELTTSHSGADYAWWIENKIGASLDKYIGRQISIDTARGGYSILYPAGTMFAFTCDRAVTVSIKCDSGEIIIIPQHVINSDGSKNSSPVAQKISAGQNSTFGLYPYAAIVIFLARSTITFDSVIDASDRPYGVYYLSIN